MSRPILSRPRTHIYSSNYDKGESYYKPMVDHLDRKYSGRPLFPEPRNTLADEIAARRSDIGTHDLSGPRTGSLGRDLDLEFDPRNRTSQLPPFTDPLLPHDDEDTVYDSRGQRTRRGRLGDDFAEEVASTTRRFRARVAAMGLEDELEAATTAGQARRSNADLLENAVTSRKGARMAIEEAESSFKRRSRLLDEIERTDDAKSPLTRWSKLINEEDDLMQTSAAASRAKQTKARLHDLESEMEELAARQAKRERRAAALRALVNENTAASDDIAQQSMVSKKVSIRSMQGSRNLSGNRDDYYDDLDFLVDGRGRPIQEDPYEHDFVITHRRFKERAAAAFEEDMAELRRKRRDMQDRIFDVIDLNAEIEKAKSTLQAADIIFQRHATKFDNQDNEQQTMSLEQKLDRTQRKTANIDLMLEKPKPKPFLTKWIKIPAREEPENAQSAQIGRQRRINSLIDTGEIVDPLEVVALQPIKSRFLKRKKSVSF